MKNPRPFTPESDAMMAKMLDQLLDEVDAWIASARAAGCAASRSRLSAIATHDTTLLNRIAAGKGGITLRSYCNVLSFIRSWDPGKPLPRAMTAQAEEPQPQDRAQVLEAEIAARQAELQRIRAA